MRYNLCSVIVIILLYSVVLEAQTNISIRKNEYKTGSAGFNEAWKHVKDGDKFYLEGGAWYNRAFDEYLQAIIYNNSNAELNYKIGVSALFSDRKEESAGFFLKALEHKSNVAEDILLLTGRALQYSDRFTEAIDKFNSYLNSPLKKPKESISLATNCIEECKSAAALTKDTLRIEIENMGANINTSTDEYAEIFSADGRAMYFASRRGLPKSSSYYPDAKFDDNIFIATLNAGTWTLASVAGKNLTTKYCETPLYIDSANTRLYIYAGYDDGGDVLVSENKRGAWQTPEQVPFGINSGGSETSFTFSPSLKEIYFVTDNGKDNLGGKDIYFIRKISERKWSKPQNVGSGVNTIYNEESVRFSKYGDTLWFSSKGHNSMGGFDVFYSLKNPSGEWGKAVNYGYPVNTQWDELFYYPSPLNDSSFYFVSNRKGGFGGLDVYKGRILPPEPVITTLPPAPPKPDTVVIRDTVVVVKEIPPPIVQPAPVVELVLYLTGKVVDSETGKPVIAKIDAVDLSTDIAVATTASSDLDGSYRLRIPAKKSYMIDVRATGYLSDMKRINIPETYSQDAFNLDVTLIKVKVGKKVVMNNILFETGKTVLSPVSYSELDRLVKLMEENPQMKIEISGHTDKTGSEPVNFKLSENRAKSVVEYMVQKGVDKSRMEFRGYGSLQPISDNATPAGRAKNRRVEFKILEF